MANPFTKLRASKGVLATLAAYLGRTGSTDLTIGTIADRGFLRRSGTTVAGVARGETQYPIARVRQEAQVGSDEVLAATAYYKFGTGSASLTLRYSEPGATGNTATAQLLEAGSDTPLSVDLVGKDLTVNLATNAGGVAISTAAEVKAAVELATAWTADIESGGGGTVVPAAVQSLTGGLDYAAEVPFEGHAPLTVDDTELAGGDAVLYTFAHAKAGLYVVTTPGTGSDGVWTRHPDWPAAAALLGGQLVGVSVGTTHGGTVVMSRSRAVLGTDTPTWAALAVV